MNYILAGLLAASLFCFGTFISVKIFVTFFLTWREQEHFIARYGERTGNIFAIGLLSALAAGSLKLASWLVLQ